MALSKKHYKQIANILNELNDDYHNLDKKQDICSEVKSSFDLTVLKVCSFLKSDNPNFNADKFIDAVYGK